MGRASMCYARVCCSHPAQQTYCKEGKANNSRIRKQLNEPNSANARVTGFSANIRMCVHALVLCTYQLRYVYLCVYMCYSEKKAEQRLTRTNSDWRPTELIGLAIYYLLSI